MMNDVAFYVKLSQTTSITEGSILIYDVIVTNVGDGYNVDFGSFVTPIHGLYYIELYMQTYQNVNSPLGIFLNSEAQCTAQALTDYEQGTCSILMELQVGDVINVRATIYDVTVYVGSDASSNGLVGYLHQAL